MTTHRIKAGQGKGTKVTITGSHSPEKAWTREQNKEVEILRPKSSLERQAPINAQMQDEPDTDDQNTDQ